jgi:Arm DNA-binding domain
MRTRDRLSASFVRGLRRPGKFGEGSGLLLQATATSDGVISKSWQFRFQHQGRERYMGLGSASVVSLAEARELAYEICSTWAGQSQVKAVG